MNVDFGREQRLVDLAIKLQHGDITPEERQEAADSLSFTAGARLGYEHLATELRKRLDFVTRVLQIFWTADNEDMLFWRVDNNQPSFYVLCSDTFAWATADLEEITPDNIDLLERSIEDVKALDFDSVTWAFSLFCARVRRMRIMPIIAIPELLREMFDACGPERTSNDFLE